MNNFDGSRINEMNEILSFLNSAQTRSGYIDHEFVYSALCAYNLKPGERMKNAQGQEYLRGVSVRKYFPLWNERFQNRHNVVSFVDPNWENFCQFVSLKNTPRGPYIKLYIPLDQEHLYNGANMIFDFIDKNNIRTQSKIGQVMRVDNVIVRLDANDIESAKKIIDFIHRTPYLRDGMNKVNPFIPTINGIGYMKERGNSYNSDLTDYIVEYINNCKKTRHDANAADFKAFLEQCKRNNHVLNRELDTFDDSLLEVFNNAYYGRKTPDLSVVNSVDRRMGAEEKNALITETIKATYFKYGIGQVQTALYEAATNNNYIYFTNNGDKKCRDRMQRSVKPQDIIAFINNMSKKSKTSLKGKIIEVCAKMFPLDSCVILDDACRCTIEKYGELQCAGAIRKYINLGDISSFSRFRGGDKSINHRENIRRLGRSILPNIMLRSLANRSIEFDPNNGQDLASFYSSVVAQELYALQR